MNVRPIDLVSEQSSANGSFAGARRSPLGFDLRDALRMLNRRKGLLIGTVAVVAALGFVVLQNLTPRFTAQTLVMLDQLKQKVAPNQEVLSGLPVDMASMQGEIEIIKSRNMARRVIAKLKLADDPEFNPNLRPSFWSFAGDGGLVSSLGLNRVFGDETTPAKQMDELAVRTTVENIFMRNLAVSPRGRSYVMGISFESANPKKAAQIANAVADFYLVDQLEVKFEATKRATDWLNERLGDLRKRVQESEAAVAVFRERNKLVETRDMTVNAQQLTELNTQLTLARAQRAEREARLTQVRDLLRSSGGTESAAEVLASPLIQRLREQESEVARREADLATRYGPNHPQIINVRAEYADLKKKIEDEVAKIVRGFAQEVEVAKTRENSMANQLANLERQSGDLGRAAVQLRQLQREAESNRTIYESFLNRFKETREQEDIQQPDARVVSEAVVPVLPSFPRYTFFMLLAIGGGFLLGVALIVTVERLDGGFRTPDQIEAATGLPTLGAVPIVTGLKNTFVAPHDYVVQKPTSSYGEALRSVYTAINLGSLDRQPKVIMVTSSLPEEGKSTFTVSLARLLAKSGTSKKVIIVDCDLRRPTVHKLLTKDKGASVGTIDEYLSGTKTFEQVVGIDEKSGLHYITAKTNTPNPTEILESNLMREFIASLSKSYDLVILDTPPVMAVSDARIISQLTDYIVFLVRWESTPRELATNAVKLLTDTGRRVGVALSRVDLRRHAKYG